MQWWKYAGSASVLAAATVSFGGVAEAPRGAASSQPEALLRILLLGDVMLDRAVRIAGNARGYDDVLGGFAPLFSGADIVVFNLEGPVTDEPSVSAGSVVGSAKNYVFTFEPEALRALRALSTSTLIAGLGNNHIQNFGSAGIAQTHAYLKQAGISYFGSPQGEKSLSLALPDGTVSFVSYNEFAADTAVEYDDTLSEIRRFSDLGDVVIVFAHWGVEYVPTAPVYVRRTAHAFVDAGADFVAGAHPHVMQDSESYRDVRIYYSLGNAVFDQYWEDAVRCGAALRLSIKKGVVEDVEPVPLYLERGGSTAVGDAAAQHCTFPHMW